MNEKIKKIEDLYKAIVEVRRQMYDLEDEKKELENSLISALSGQEWLECFTINYRNIEKRLRVERIG